MRIGNVNPKPLDKRRLSIWLSPRDLAQLVSIGIDHPDIRFEIVYGVSGNKRSWYDNSNAVRLGYQPQDDAERFADEILPAREAGRSPCGAVPGRALRGGRGSRQPGRRAPGGETMKLRVPEAACDTHMHFYDGVAAARPGTPNPGRFTVPMYRELQKKLGLERVVVVQPNAYGDDNRVTLDSLREIGHAARGVAVVKPDVSDAELERLTNAGIRAVRIMTLHGGMLGFEVMDAVMARVHPFGWHANIQLDGRELPKYEAQIRRLPGRFVIDHTGKFLEPVPLDSRGVRFTVEAGRHRPLLGQALGPLRNFEDRRSEVRGRRPIGQSAGRARARAHALGEQLAASLGARPIRPTTWS